MYINGFTRESVMRQIRDRNLGYPAYNYSGEQCMYRANDGNQCLVGCFIPDNLYEEEFEGLFAAVIFDKMPEKMPIVRPMLIKFQDFHDRYNLEDETPETFFKDIEHKLTLLEKQWEEEND